MSHRERSGRRLYWAFQANPNIYDIERAVQSLTYDTWTTKRSDVRAGDRALIWKSGGGTPVRGIVALAEVLDDPRHDLDPDTTYWLDTSDRQHEPRVPIRYVVPPGCPVWVTADTQPILQALSVWNAQGTVFRVTPEQWRAVVGLAGGWPGSIDREIRDQSAKLAEAGDFDPISAIDGRERVIRNVLQRQGQPAFRNALLNAYGGACAISGCTAAPALEAAHILPYGGLHTNDVTNGLLLRADLHTLFDMGLLAINPDRLTVEVASPLVDTEYADFAGRRLRHPLFPDDEPSRDALRQHRALSRLGET